MITDYFITAKQYFNKNTKEYEEMKVFCLLFVCSAVSKIKAGKVGGGVSPLTFRLGNMRKLMRRSRKLGLPIIPTSTERSIATTGSHFSNLFNIHTK